MKNLVLRPYKVYSLSKRLDYRCSLHAKQVYPTNAVYICHDVMWAARIHLLVRQNGVAVHDGITYHNRIFAYNLSKYQLDESSGSTSYGVRADIYALGTATRVEYVYSLPQVYNPVPVGAYFKDIWRTADVSDRVHAQLKMTDRGGTTRATPTNVMNTPCTQKQAPKSPSMFRKIAQNRTFIRSDSLSYLSPIDSSAFITPLNERLLSTLSERSSAT